MSPQKYMATSRRAVPLVFRCFILCFYICFLCCSHCLFFAISFLPFIAIYLHLSLTHGSSTIRTSHLRIIVKLSKIRCSRHLTDATHANAITHIHVHRHIFFFITNQNHRLEDGKKILLWMCVGECIQTERLNIMWNIHLSLFNLPRECKAYNENWNKFRCSWFVWDSDYHSTTNLSSQKKRSFFFSLARINSAGLISAIVKLISYRLCVRRFYDKPKTPYFLKVRSNRVKSRISFCRLN